MAEDFFDEPVAAAYDTDSAAMFGSDVVEPVVEFLTANAGPGGALELGIGTGRIALPLAGRGIAVDGIDLSEAMVERLRTKPGGSAIDVTVGDFARVRTGSRYSLVYLVFNTIMNLTTQRAQVDCFRNTARHLRPGGRFVVEVEVPDLQRLSPGERFQPFHIDEGHWGLNEYDLPTQGLVSHHLRFVDGGTRRNSVPFRYVWPTELDLMAEIAGMTLVGRWGGWQREPFTADSRGHVSVWETPSR